MTQPAERELLNRLVGAWASEATHPASPGLVVAGSATGEWLEGERFFLLRTQSDHPDFPDALSVLGEMDEGLASHYFDSRGVHRVYRLGVDGGVWRLWRDEPGFNQRFTGTFEDSGDRIVGVWEFSPDGSDWQPDLRITFVRRPG
ncbi:MAG TPA: hypothetical protein VFO73_02575 [Candidatus Limnocylindrales bacterium]|nr:hypothetical protein [Candidatus Limnocylindrales bacterium]